MREILVDHARRKRALKRGGTKVTLDESLVPFTLIPHDFFNRIIEERTSH